MTHAVSWIGSGLNASENHPESVSHTLREKGPESVKS
jgi:hypothetical protein